jgi:hypothetical protein
MSTTEDLPLFLRGNFTPLTEERTLAGQLGCVHRCRFSDRRPRHEDQP